jgi:hypothetical protein
VGNVVVPQTIEVSFVRRGLYEIIPETRIFPTELDAPNEPGRADLFLGTFTFG